MTRFTQIRLLAARRLLMLAFGISLAIGQVTRAADEPSPCLQCHGDGCGFARAGNPQCLAAHARPSNGPGDVGYYVGGGSAFHGQPRGINEGTWGWDYSGIHLERIVALGWWHGQRYQGGTGQYKTDGPRPLH